MSTLVERLEAEADSRRLRYPETLDLLREAAAALRATTGEGGCAPALESWERLSMETLAVALRERGDDLSTDSASWLEKWLAAAPPPPLRDALKESEVIEASVFQCRRCPVSVESRWQPPDCPECGDPCELDASAKPAPTPPLRDAGAVAWQIRRTDFSTAPWEACTPDAYDDTLRTGRFLGFDNGPPAEVRALYAHPAPPPPLRDAGAVKVSVGGLNGVPASRAAAQMREEAKRLDHRQHLLRTYGGGKTDPSDGHAANLLRTGADALDALATHPAPAQVDEVVDWPTIVEGLRLADQFFDGDDKHWQWDDGEAFPGSKVRAAKLAALAAVAKEVDRG